MEKQKRVLAVHDISCIGKCSLTVALPIISAAGIETSILPTAVLSTHTGGFTGYTFRDLTDDIKPISDHWKTLDLHFDSIYTGYLGSSEQLNLVSDLFDDFKSDDTLILVDPVMADNGILYPSFAADFPMGMKELCKKADIIIPNITEACLMLGMEYEDGPYTREYIEGILAELSNLSSKGAVLTGVYFENGKLGAACIDSDGKIGYYFTDTIDGYYHGTGDVFGSALLSAVLNRKTLADAMKIAVDFTAGSIKRTHDAGTDVKYGVNFEAGLADLAKAVK